MSCTSFFAFLFFFTLRAAVPASAFINALWCFRKSLQREKRRGFTIIFRIMRTCFVSKMLTKMLTACFKLCK